MPRRNLLALAAAASASLALVSACYSDPPSLTQSEGVLRFSLPELKTRDRLRASMSRHVGERERNGIEKVVVSNGNVDVVFRLKPPSRKQQLRAMPRKG